MSGDIYIYISNPYSCKCNHRIHNIYIYIYIFSSSFPECRAENYNTSAVEFLRRLPGVTDSNYRAIMDECKCLADLALVPVERLAELMGGHKAAKTLRDFLDAKYPTLV